LARILFGLYNDDYDSRYKRISYKFYAYPAGAAQGTTYAPSDWPRTYEYPRGIAFDGGGHLVMGICPDVTPDGTPCGTSILSVPSLKPIRYVRQKTCQKDGPFGACDSPSQHAFSDGGAQLWENTDALAQVTGYAYPQFTRGTSFGYNGWEARALTIAR
jgi:hypothetical protein